MPVADAVHARPGSTSSPDSPSALLSTLLAIRPEMVLAMRLAHTLAPPPHVASGEVTIR
jgi:hypothetical protein